MLKLTNIFNVSPVIKILKYSKSFTKQNVTIFNAQLLSIKFKPKLVNGNNSSKNENKLFTSCSYQSDNNGRSRERDKARNLLNVPSVRSVIM